jgi:peptidoglycan/LPS O-acetylase OafA/YrhL
MTPGQHTQEQSKVLQAVGRFSHAAFLLSALWAGLVVMATSIGSSTPKFVQFLIPLVPALMATLLGALALFFASKGWKVRAVLAGVLAVVKIPGLFVYALTVGFSKSVDRSYDKDPK